MSDGRSGIGLEAVDPRAAGAHWLALSREYTRLAYERTERLDLVVHVAPGVADGHAGAFVPALSRISLDGAAVGVDPGAPGAPSQAGAHVVLRGVYVHEEGHALHTRPGPWPDDPLICRCIDVLEEIRMEARVVEHRPDDARWLRAAARALLVGTSVEEELATAPTRLDAALASALTEGRVAAGSLTPNDVGAVARTIDRLFGAQVGASLRDLWDMAVAVEDGDWDELAELAELLLELVGDDEEPLDEPDALGLRAALDASAGRAADDAVRSIAGEDAVPRTAPAPGLAVAAARAHRAGAIAMPIRWRPRPPTASEVAARRALAARLLMACARDRLIVRVPARRPPGRLRGREAVRAAAQRELGHPIDVRLWRARRRTTVDEPRLRAGILVDVSGSMSGAEEGLASALWVLANAVSDVDGELAGVAFGDEVELLVTAAAPPPHVLALGASASKERVAEAIALADRELALSTASGARMLVIVSDGIWTIPDDVRLTTLELERLRTAGVAVIQVGIGDPPRKHPADRRVQIDAVEQLATIVGDACVTALREARA